VYEVEAKKGGMRPTTLADARKLDLYPSVTLILKVAARPGLEQWKQQQLLMSALTLPQLVGETLDDYARRVSLDAQEQARKAAERGTALHAAIEEYVRGQLSLEWQEHVFAVEQALAAHGINIEGADTEHSFTSVSFSYGGKLDWKKKVSEDPTLIDFKTKDRIDNKKPLVYDEHVQQLAAYGFGMHPTEKFRALNVFIGVEDKQVRIIEHEMTDLEWAFEQFKLLLEYWKMKNRFGIYAK
jgi:hypothetical protein